MDALQSAGARTPQPTARHLGMALVVVAALSWSTAGLFTRVVETDLPTTIFWRSLFGALFLMALCAAMRGGPARGGLLRFSRGEFVVGALVAGGTLCYISAFFHTTIANVSIMYGATPLVTFALAFVILRERAGRVALACCAMCALGIAVIVWGAQRFDDLLGIALGVAMTFFIAGMTIAAKYFPDASMAKATYLAALLCALATAPFASPFAASAIDYGWLALYGLFTVAFGFGAYLIGAQRVPALTAAMLGLIEIPTAPLWAWLLFAEPPGRETVLGGVIVLAATALYLLAGAQAAAVRRAPAAV